MSEGKDESATEAFPLAGWPRQLEERDGRILHAMRSYQIIELCLKVYLSGKRAGLPDDADTVLPAFADLPLGRLIGKFVAANGNTALHAQLKGIVAERNLIAHQALAMASESAAGMLGVPVLDLARIRDIERRANRAMTALVVEFVRTTPRSAP